MQLTYKKNSLQNKPIVLLYPTGIDFVEAFFGAIFGGAIPVPIQSPFISYTANSFEQLIDRVHNLNSKTIFTDSSILNKLSEFIDKSPEIEVINSQKISLDPSLWQKPVISAETPAYIQYTSGSTQSAKAVTISHENLMAGAQVAYNASLKKTGLVHVNWLPHYHDMGLMGAIVSPLYFGDISVLISPQSFLRKPLNWLKNIEYFKATHSGAPTFAYALTLETIKEQDRKELNLESWKRAFCGSEPIDSKVLKDFAKAFEISNFNRDAFFSGYGMAETTFFVSGKLGLETVSVNREKLANNIVEIENRPTSKELVSLGKPYDATQIVIIDSNQEVLRENKIGEIWIKGKSISHKYFDGKSILEKGYIHSGDLGFIHNGELFICGRKKETIIIRGVNYYPQDIESVITHSVDQVQMNSVAVFGSEIDDIESFVVLVGVRDKRINLDSEIEIFKNVKEAILENFGIAPGVITLVKAGEIPKTSSGKIQRLKCRDMWNENLFTVFKTIQYNNRNSPYKDLEEKFIKLDNRKTNYRFDIDRDVDWELFEKDGRYFPDSFLSRYGFDIDKLKKHQDIHRYSDMLLGLSQVLLFSIFEKHFLLWEQTIFPEVQTKSFEMLCDEEIKHAKLFDMYGDRVKSEYPDMYKNIMTHVVPNYYELLSYLTDYRNYENSRHNHYSLWLWINYFERYSIWIDDTLSELGDEVQPLWKLAQYLHRKEEEQHTLTATAYFKSIIVDEDEMKRWTKQLMDKIHTIFSKTASAQVEIIKNQFQEIDLFSKNSQFGSMYDVLFTHKIFESFRELIPNLEEIINMPLTEDRSSDREEQTDLEWLKDSVAKLVKSDSSQISTEDSFIRLGLDSLGHLTLATAIEEKFGIEVENNIAYNNRNIDQLFQYLKSKNIVR